MRHLELERFDSLASDVAISWLSIKGPALAIQTANDQTARGIGDIDVFVAPNSVDIVYAALRDSGWIARPVGSAVPDSWAWRHILGTFNEMTFDSLGSTIDLHWRLDPTHAALPHFDSSWSRRQSVVIGELAVQTLGLRDAFAHSCRHALKDDGRWARSLVDIHRLARLPEIRDGGLFDRVETTALAITDACLGLPGEMAGTMRITGAGVRASRRALAAQERAPIANSPSPERSRFATFATA